MRGFTFTLEAVVTLLLIFAIASVFVFPVNQDRIVTYNLVAMDVADLASSENFWQMPFWQQQRKVEEWSFAAGPCVKLVKGDLEVESINCPDSADEQIAVDRVYFDKATGEMAAFIVLVTPPR